MSPQPPLLDLYQQQVQTGRIKPDASQSRAVTALQDLAFQLQAAPARRFFPFPQKKNGRPLKGIYLHGPVGRGKSMLMDLFFSSLPKSVTKRRVHFHAFMIEVHDWLHKNRGQNMDDLLPQLAKDIAGQVRVLCFDEFHVTDVADAMILGRLFTSILERGVVVVATSNWEPDRLYEGGLQRELFLPFIGLLKKSMDVFALTGETDYRARKLNEEGVYFWPIGKSATVQADTLFAQLTGGAIPHRAYLDVKGRRIKVNVAANGVARFTFSELCEVPHGAEDFLTIAKTYRAIFLEGVPQINYDRRNEAKRLMLLIDALYENKTKLVVTAEVPPEELYQGHHHGFEFQRTVSRLMEMQGREYLEGGRGPQA